MEKKLIIAIDGPSGAGKSTLSRMLAQRLDYNYIDTGAMYRAVALKAHREKVGLAELERIEKMCLKIKIDQKMMNNKLHTYLNGEDVSDEIRIPLISKLSSDYSALTPIRKRLIEMQREMGKGGGVVLEGRDITTVVFPNADIKFYLDASIEERGNRRCKELKDKGLEVDLNEIVDEIRKRDRNDSLRELSPLKIAEGAVYIDTTKKAIDEVLDNMLEYIKKLVTI